MYSANIRRLIQFRLDQADEAVRAARLLFDQHFLRDVVNRSYYGMFYAVLALLLTQQLGTSKHSGAISLFDREFVRPGIFTRELSAWLHEAFEMRLTADYAELAAVSSEEAQRVLHHAHAFISQARGYLNALLADTSNAEDPETHA